MSRLAADPVFTALTRPQMIFGVTYDYAVFNLIVTVELFLVTRSFWTLLCAAAVHVAGYVACIREPRFFELWIMNVRTCPRVRNYRYWRCNSYRP